jgi:hypothetical protein
MWNWFENLSQSYKNFKNLPEKAVNLALGI